MPALVLLALLGCRETLYSPVDAPAENPSKDYGELLSRVVGSDGMVNYDALEADREALDNYVAWLQVEEAWKGSRPTERPAEWVNAYNALVLFQVLERKRPESVLDVRGFLPIDGAKFFYGTQFAVNNGEYLSLSEIEHERVRQAELDFRVHAVLNCASKSCPPLRAKLYTHRGFPQQLREQFGAWVDDPRGLYFENEEVVFNPIFDWYARDFEFFSGGQNLCEITSKYASGKRARELKKMSEAGCPHRFFEYDWSLNDASAP